MAVVSVSNPVRRQDGVARRRPMMVARRGGGFHWDDGHLRAMDAVYIGMYLLVHARMLGGKKRI